MIRAFLLLGLILVICGPSSVLASPQPSLALGKLTRLYHFELIAQACVRHGLLDPKVVTSMQQTEAGYAQMLPPGTNLKAAKAKVAEGTRDVASRIGFASKLFCQGLATDVF